MNKKHQIILSALMLGIGSGWAALNQNIFANEDNVVPEVIENEESGNAIQENGESTPAAESEEEMLSAKKRIGRGNRFFVESKRFPSQSRKRGR